MYDSKHRQINRKKKKVWQQTVNSCKWHSNTKNCLYFLMDIVEATKYEWERQNGDNNFEKLLFWLILFYWIDGVKTRSRQTIHTLVSSHIDIAKEENIVTFIDRKKVSAFKTLHILLTEQTSSQCLDTIFDYVL